MLKFALNLEGITNNMITPQTNYCNPLSANFAGIRPDVNANG